MNRSRPGTVAVLLALATLGAACERGATGPEATIESTRVASRESFRVIPGLPLVDRLGVRPQEAPVPPDDPSRDVIPFDHDAMPGWTALAPVAPFRHVNLRFDADPRAELTVAAYEDRGGLVRNVNRWRTQVGEEALSAEEVEALPRVKLLGNGEGTLVEAFGPYQGMGGPRIEDGALLGAIVTNGQFTLFVKMTGPRDVLAAERAHFDGFLASLRPGEAPPEPGAGASPLTWEAPPGWTEEPSTSQFREVTFRRGAVEIALGLARGTVESNVVRWAGQLGLEPPDDAAIAALRRVPSMGTEAVVFEGVGAFQGMGDPAPRADQRMLGAIVRVPDGGGAIATLKAIGPNDEVAAARDDFDAILQSLAKRSR